jgi:esterase/lipase
LRKYQSGEITKDEYRKYMSQMTITSFEWQQLLERITDTISEINQRALTNIVNEDLEKIYIDNYNTIIRAIGGDLTEN